MSNNSSSLETRREQFLERPLPSSEDSEKAILGGILLDNSLIEQAVEKIKPKDFYSPFHRRIFKAMLCLFEASKSIDPILIGEELKKDGPIGWIEGISMITNLTYGMPYFSDLTSYLDIVKDKSVLRSLIRTCNQITSEALEEEEKASVVLDHAEHRIYKLKDIEKTEIQTSTELIDLSNQEVENMQDQDIQITGVPSGYAELDIMTGGYQKADLIIIASRPSMGKTALGCCIGEYAAFDEGKVVVNFSLEMSKKAIARRIICSRAEVDSFKYRTGNLTEEEWGRIHEAREKMNNGHLLLDDTSYINTMYMRAKCRRIVKEYGSLDLVLVDYLQLMSSNVQGLPREQEVSSISRDLKALAKDFDVPVIAMAQLSRKPENRKDSRPTLGDLRESGGIEQDADVVQFIYRNDYYIKDEMQKTGVAEIIIGKQRNGATGTVELKFISQFTKFTNIEYEF